MSGIERKKGITEVAVGMEADTELGMPLVNTLYEGYAALRNKGIDPFAPEQQGGKGRLYSWAAYTLDIERTPTNDALLEWYIDHGQEALQRMYEMEEPLLKSGLEAGTLDTLMRMVPLARLGKRANTTEMITSQCTSSIFERLLAAYLYIGEKPDLFWKHIDRYRVQGDYHMLAAYPLFQNVLQLRWVPGSKISTVFHNRDFKQMFQLAPDATTTPSLHWQLLCGLFHQHCNQFLPWRGFAYPEVPEQSLRERLDLSLLDLDEPGTALPMIQETLDKFYRLQDFPIQPTTREQNVFLDENKFSTTQEFVNYLHHLLANGLMVLGLFEWDKLDPLMQRLWGDPRHVLALVSFDSSTNSFWCIDGTSATMVQYTAERLFHALHQDQLIGVGLTHETFTTKREAQVDMLVKTPEEDWIRQKLQDQLTLGLQRAEVENYPQKHAFIAAVMQNIDLFLPALLVHELVSFDVLNSFPGNLVLATQLWWLERLGVRESEEAVLALSRFDELMTPDQVWREMLQPIMEQEGAVGLAPFILQRPQYEMPQRYESIFEVMKFITAEYRHVMGIRNALSGLPVFDFGGGTGVQWQLPYMKSIVDLFLHSVVIDISSYKDTLSPLASIWPGDKYQQRGYYVSRYRPNATFIQQPITGLPMNLTPAERDIFSFSQTINQRPFFSILSFMLHQNASQIRQIMDVILPSIMAEESYVFTLGEPNDFLRHRYPLRVYTTIRTSEMPSVGTQLRLQHIASPVVMGPDQMTVVEWKEAEFAKIRRVILARVQASRPKRRARK